MLKITELKKSYPGFKLDISFEAPNGTIVGLIGRNGAGKSTVLKAIGDLISRDAGTIEFNGTDVKNMTSDQKEQFGYVFPDSTVPENFSVSDTIKLLKVTYKNFNESQFNDLVKRLKLPIDKSVKEMSTGNKAKLKTIIALTHNANLLILDEPTAGLDVVVRQQIIEVLQDYLNEDESRSILITTHISSDLESLADRVILIDDGNIVFEEDTDVIIDSYALLKMTGEQYDKVDKQYLLHSEKTDFGYSTLTNEKNFYVENYPDVAIEPTSIDDIILFLVGGINHE
ncbi:ABC transporter ATP-binding protein [Lentilactobacillus sp. Marseille-Q4993]|uniref:ABC transporter ATP-binding protein n=1 Tax=Lentilactobacillus sp. Marseille-Q4993 TaxID=3039492 RepID=UPI0024BCEF61|nr:ABC transporter ATP-binding protein [Lentilactobacillus sp. Marseille-Q4993]